MSALDSSFSINRYGLKKEKQQKYRVFFGSFLSAASLLRRIRQAKKRVPYLKRWFFLSKG